MQRHQYVALSAIAFLIAVPALAQDDEIDSVVLLGTNSVKIGRTSFVTGNVVANDQSPGPVLDEGAELAVDTGATVDGNASGDTVDLDRGSAVTGNVSYNELFKHANVTIGGDEITPLEDLPVFDELPPFPAAIVAGGGDIAVGVGQTLFLGAGSYGDIEIAKGGKLVLGGSYKVRSISPAFTMGGQCPFPCRSVLFAGPTVLEVEERFDTDANSFVGPAGEIVVPDPPDPMDPPDAFPPDPNPNPDDPPYDPTNCSGAEALIQVAGTNGGAGAPGSLPAAINPGKNSVFCATVQAPNGTFLLERESDMVGAVVARDVQIDRQSTVILDSFFAPRVPLALSCNAVLDGEQPIVITLEGFDPAGENLTFNIFSDPSSGAIVSGPTPIVPGTTGRCSVSQFVCEDLVGSVDCPLAEDVCEPLGLCDVSQSSCIDLTGSGDCPVGETCVQETGPVTQATLVYQPDTPCPIDPETESPVCAEDSFSFDVTNESGEVSEATVCEIDLPDPGVPGVINNVQANDDLVDVPVSSVVEITLNAGAPAGTTVVFSIEELPTAGTLTLPGGGPVVVGADLASPTVVYSAPASAGTDSFLFEARASGDPAGTPCDGADLSDQTDACGQVSIDARPLRELAEDQTVTTALNEPVAIDLTANEGGTGVPVDGLGLAELKALAKAGAEGWTAKAAAESWTLTGSMGQARAGHLAVRLEDQILVTDGSTAELYDPSEGTFSPAASPTSRGSDFTLTRLADGRALLLGGSDAQGLAEIYDDGTGQWTAVTASLNDPRSRHKAVLLGDGTVLIIGGRQVLPVPEGDYDPICNPIGCDLISTLGSEIFDPADGTFTVATGGPSAKFNHEATRLQDGRVLVTGGEGEGGSTCAFPLGTCSETTTIDCAADSQCPEGETCIEPGCFAIGTAIFINPLLEVYDPATESSTFGEDELFGGTLTLLADGRVLVSGGSSARLYTPDAGTGSLGGFISMVGSRSNDHTATLLQTGEVLLAGGGSAGATAELFDPADETFAATGSMTTARRDHTATLLEDGQVMITGGSDGVSPLASAELYARVSTDPRLVFEILTISDGTLTDPATGLAVTVGSTFTSPTSLVYTPPEGDTTTQTVTYSVTEASLVTDTATITVFVDPNDPCIPVGRPPGCSPD